MISKTFNRYIWLMNTLLQYKQLTFEEINVLWKESCLGDGTPLPLRTFHQHKNAVEELFGIEIKCNPSNGYKYYISTPGTLKNDSIRKWLLNSFTLSNMISAGHNMKDRILFEEIPCGTEYLQTVIEAMQKSKELIVDYQRFYGRRETFNIQPYAIKVYHQRWYVVGYIKELGGIRNIALDRTLEMNLSDISFTLPQNFNAEKYYANTVGIYVNEELNPVKVKIRAYGVQIEYLRSLPLHRSQKESASKYGEFCDFEYKLCLTPELSTHILAMGENVEVLEPVELREEIKRRLEECLTKYKL
ncbi:MAG: WYL domain-containing protein [Bacteroidaceae bacterium]|nr:WYL domain-containing protein [Bacteroidaceae bacterium]